MSQIRRYNVYARPEAEKLGIQFNGLPPGVLTVKSVTDGSFGDVRGIEEGDVLIQVGPAGQEPLLSLDDVAGETFKSLLKQRPLHLVFESRRQKYTVYADAKLTKLGIAFHGMPPGQLVVKNVSDDSFAEDQGVFEGDVLLRVGKDERDMVSLEDLSEDNFKGFLKDRPLRLEFQSSTAKPPDQAVPEQAAPRTEHTESAAEGTSHQLTDQIFEIVADASVDKIGIAFHGMPPGQLVVKNVSDDSFAEERGVFEGDVLLRVGKDEPDMVRLEDMSEDNFKGFLKDRPLRLEFQSSTAKPPEQVAKMLLNMQEWAAFCACIAAFLFDVILGDFHDLLTFGFLCLSLVSLLISERNAWEIGSFQR